MSDSIYLKQKKNSIYWEAQRCIKWVYVMTILHLEVRWRSTWRNMQKREAIPLDIVIFGSGSEYLKYLQAEAPIDILFLDIEL